MILVTGVRALNNDELLILASYAGVSGSQYQVAAEDILDTACSTKGGVRARTEERRSEAENPHLDRSAAAWLTRMAPP
jgi:hypothetical protein